MSEKWIPRRFRKATDYFDEWRAALEPYLPELQTSLAVLVKTQDALARFERMDPKKTLSYLRAALDASTALSVTLADAVEAAEKSLSTYDDEG